MNRRHLFRGLLGALAGGFLASKLPKDRIHYLTKEEQKAMPVPFPPEPGYCWTVNDSRCGQLTWTGCDDTGNCRIEKVWIAETT